MTQRIWIRPLGNCGNRALQYLVAAGIQAHAPEAVIENLHLPEWGLVAHHPRPPAPRSVTTGQFRFWLDVAGFGDCLRRGVVDSVLMDGYSYHLANYPPRAIARTLLGPTPGGTEATGFGPHELVCSVRAAEVLGNVHPDYIVLPPLYYKKLAQRTGLELVFFGQLGDDSYSQSLRAAFPAARFIPGRNPEYDFDTLRRSVNIAPSVSTFSWLAAWLSEAARIYLPVCGLFSPVQLPHMMYLPLDDPHFEYTLLPYAHAISLHVEPAKFMFAQEVLGQMARPVSPAELREICQRATALYPRMPLLSGFDNAHYLRRYPDIADIIAAGISREDGLHSALEHYHFYGFFQNREPLALDIDFYTSTYPDAAMAIAEGHFLNPLHHYQAVGYAKGYRPVP
jgi:hypothetical protein